jgi:branched-chain amino acid transport system ATP-binding protein
MLELRKVDAAYGAHTVLRNVTLRVPDGAIVALLGANGAGKTTALRVASGLLRPIAGQLVLNDEDVTGKAPNELVRRGVCHVPEGRGIFPTLSVRENLVMQHLQGAESRLDEVLGIFPALERRFSQSAGTLSGGEQQMLALARAYIQRPEVVLLDEVSMGLAPVVVDQIFEFIGLLAQNGSSLLLVEQYVTRALAVADYVYLLHRGEVRFVGEPDELEEGEIFKQYVGADL